MANDIEIPSTTGPDPASPGSPGEAGLAVGGRESVGRYLSRQRRMRGITLEELSENTRIPVRSLERLEGGRFDGDADGFVRGFVRTVGEALGLDPDDTVSRLLSEVQVDAESRGTRVSLQRTVLAVCAVLVAAGLLGFGRWILGGESTAALDASHVIYRQDPVRALADAVAAQGSGSASERPLPLVPTERPPAPAPSVTADAQQP